MMRSMFAGVSGLRNHQTRMDVIGNNIANVNTVGFKSSRVTFRQLFSQTLRGASRPGTARGGTNPIQIGLGSTLGSISPVFTQGNVQITGNDTDLALNGNGFFILDDGGVRVYTRAGAFGLDAEGYLVDRATGMRVQGWMATAGTLPPLTAQNLTDIQVRLGQSMPARATTNVVLVDNLDAATSGSSPIALDLFDSLGNPQSMVLTFAKTGANSWSWTSSWIDPSTGSPYSGTLTFNPDGTINSRTTVNLTFNPPGANQMDVTLDFSGVTQFAAPTSIKMLSQNGYPSGVLDSFTIDATGVITGSYSNGISLDIARVAVAGFANPAGLLDRGGGFFIESNNSGAANIGAAGTNGLGELVPGALEMSNVDLAQEFTDMIVTQRGFQANARVITTSDEILQELVNLRR